jgi:hypothetical protein
MKGEGMSEILTREDYAERITAVWRHQEMTLARRDILLQHDAALRAEVERANKCGVQAEVEIETLRYVNAITEARANAAEKERDFFSTRAYELNAEKNRLLAALREIAEGKGPFDLDNHRFACNVIENMKGIAAAAIEREGK